MPATSQKSVALKSAMTTAAPQTMAAPSSVYACVMLVRSISAGSATTAGVPPPHRSCPAFRLLAAGPPYCRTWLRRRPFPSHSRD